MSNGFGRGPKQNDIGRLTEQVSEQFRNGLFSVAPAGKYVSGARCLIKINDEILFFADQISWRIQTESVEIREIDSMTPFELAPTIVGVSGDVGGLRIPNQGLSIMQYQANALSHLFHRYFTLEVRDTTSDALLLYVGKALVTSRDEMIASEQLMASRFSWVGVAWKDEQEPQLPPEIAGADLINNPVNGARTPRNGLLGIGDQAINAVNGAAPGVTKAWNSASEAVNATSAKVKSLFK